MQKRQSVTSTNRLNQCTVRYPYRTKQFMQRLDIRLLHVLHKRNISRKVFFLRLFALSYLCDPDHEPPSDGLQNPVFIYYYYFFIFKTVKNSNQVEQSQNRNQIVSFFYPFNGHQPIELSTTPKRHPNKEHTQPKPTSAASSPSSDSFARMSSA